MLHENFEALIANISNEIDKLEPSELPSLVVTNSNVSIYHKGGTAARVLHNLLTSQPGHTYDVVFNQELQDAFAHNNMQFIKVGDNLAHGLLRTSIVADEPAVFWLDVCNDTQREILAKNAKAVVADLKKNATYPLAFNIEELAIDCNALNWKELLDYLLNHTASASRFRLKSVSGYDFSLSTKAIRYYTETKSYYPMDPVAYHNEVNLFKAHDFVDSATHWSIAPGDSLRPLVKVFV